MLDRDVRARLRTLSKDNAEIVGLHLVMTGRLIDEDPELAYEHAQAAARRGGRVDVVREAAGLTAYRTGRFAEALRELRTVRRLNGSSEHLAVMADCERGLGRPERAITLAQSPEAEGLDDTTKVELAMVVSGARLDLGDVDGALAALSGFRVGGHTLLSARVAQAKAEALRAAGRTEEAEQATAGFPAALLAQASGEVAEDEDVLLYDLEDDEDQHGAEAVEDGHETDGPDAADVDIEDTAVDHDAAVSESTADEATDELVGEHTAADDQSAAADQPVADEPDAHGTDDQAPADGDSDDDFYDVADDPSADIADDATDEHNSAESEVTGDKEDQ